jgi:drug/metabolite transporter superfamily protein YnfA
MTSDLPIVCSLTAEELPARLAEIRAVSRAALRATRVRGSSAVLHFDSRPGIRERLAAIVAAEAECCAFLTMTLAGELVATFQPSHEFGRVLAAYGGVFIVGSLLWGVAFDGFHPDRADLIGAGVCLIGVAMIMYAR